jgi:hypothetical protein
MMRKVGVLLLVLGALAAAASALAKGPPPPFTATASLADSGVGNCPGTAVVIWKNVKSGVARIDYTWLGSGAQFGGGFGSGTPGKTGSDTEQLTGALGVPNGEAFSFTAKVYSDPFGNDLIATRTSNTTAACNV